MMLPLCSTTPPSSSSSSSLSQQISIQAGLGPFSSLRNFVDDRGIGRNVDIWGLPNGSYLREVQFKTQATKFMNSHFIEKPVVSASTKLTNFLRFSNEIERTELSFAKKMSNSGGTTNAPYTTGKGVLNYIENSSTSSSGDELLSLSGQVTESSNVLSENAILDTGLSIDGKVDIAPEDTISVSSSLDVSGDAFSKLKKSILEFLSEVSAPLDDSADKGDRLVNNTFDAINSSTKYAIRNVTEAIDNVVNDVFSTIDHTGELAGNELTGFSGDLKGAIGKAGIVSVDILRQTLLSLEGYLASAGTFVVYSYGSIKESLPPDVLGVLNTIEDKIIVVLRPAGTAFGQVYIAIEGLERNLGLDSNDPVLQFTLFLVASTTLRITYQVLACGGYSGDLSPKLTLELLTAEENVVLVDVRPEELRERDGVPDLRRGARFKYASVALPKLDGSVQNLVKNGRELDDALIAAVIRNLKIVQVDRSKVVVLDADGTRSKGIARSLRKLGVKKAYLVQGGFRAWAENGLRIKELKPETTLTILNEEAEAILDDIKPTPVQIVGYGVGFIVGIYALFEWEKILELIGIIGLGQTIYRRVASYENSEDFKEDVRLLFAPVRIGAQAFSWVAGKLEPSRIGLPTSPSSSDVQNRVLVAAAKHESQPSDTEEGEDLSRESVAAVNDNIDLSEA